MQGKVYLVTLDLSLNIWEAACVKQNAYDVIGLCLKGKLHTSLIIPSLTHHVWQATSIGGFTSICNCSYSCMRACFSLHLAMHQSSVSIFKVCDIRKCECQLTFACPEILRLSKSTYKSASRSLSADSSIVCSRITIALQLILSLCKKKWLNSWDRWGRPLYTALYTYEACYNQVCCVQSCTGFPRIRFYSI